MTTATKPDIRFTFKLTPPDNFTGTLAFKAHCTYWVDEPPYGGGNVRNPLDSDFDRTLRPLADLAISAQANKEAPDDWYAWSVEYHQPYHVTLERAEVMVKFLRKVHKGLDKLDATFGRAEDLAAFCGRVAQVIGCTNDRPFGEYSDTLTMNGTHYRWHNVDALRSLLTRPLADR